MTNISLILANSFWKIHITFDWQYLSDKNHKQRWPAYRKVSFSDTVRNVRIIINTFFLFVRRTITILTLKKVYILCWFYIIKGSRKTTLVTDADYKWGGEESKTKTNFNYWLLIYLLPPQLTKKEIKLIEKQEEKKIEKYLLCLWSVFHLNSYIGFCL